MSMKMRNFAGYCASFSSVVRNAAFLCVIISAVCSLSFSSAAQASPELDHVTLQLRWFHQFQFAGYYAALEKGYYREAGLDVTILERNLSRSPVDDVLAGKADFGVSNSEVLLHYMQGRPLVVLAVVIQHSPLVLVSRADSGIRNPHDLIGRRVLMSSRTLDIELPAMLREEKVSLDSLDLKDAFAEPSDYLDPSVDALAAYYTNQPFYLEKAGIPYTVMFPSSYGIDFYGDTLFTTNKQVEKHPRRVKAFLSASIRGWEYAMAHSDEIIELILSRYGTKKSREHLKFEAERMRELMLPDLVEIGHMNPGRWEHIAGIFSKMGFGPIEYSLDGFMYDPDVRKPGVSMETVFSLAGLFIAAVFVIILLCSFNQRLKNEVRERRKAEERSAESEKYYRSVFENTGSATVIFDRDAVIRRCNAQFEELAGMAAEDIEDRMKWSDYVVPEDLERMFAHHKKRDTPDNDAPTGYEFRFLRPDGEVRHVHVQVDVIPDTRQRVASLMDMTERVKTRELLIHTEKMVSVGGLAAGMAHEINNPLAGILQGAQNLVRRLTPGLAMNDAAALKMGVEFDVIKGYMEERGIYGVLDGIKESGERAAAIVRSMLSFSRKGDSSTSRRDLNKMLDKVVTMASSDYDLKKKYDFKQVEIIRNYSPEVSSVCCIQTEVEQVFLNLVKNAAHAMKDNPSTRSPRLELSTSLEGGYAVVSIRDNGPGMREDVRRRIFEPFYTTKEPGVGTGLGLSISYFIITRNHGGVITVDSSAGVGTVFTVRLPLDGVFSE